MRKLNQNGIMNPLTIPLVLAVLVLVVSSVMAVMYYSKFVEQRDNNQPIIDEAVTKAEEAQKTSAESEQQGLGKK